MRAAAEEGEGGHVGGEELALRHAQHGVAEQMAGEGERHDERPHAPLRAALGVDPAAQVSVVELRLRARRGIVAQHRGLALGRLFGELEAHVTAQAGDAHREAVLVAQALMDSGERGGGEVLLDVGVVGRDLAVHRGSRTWIAELGEPLADLRCPLRLGEVRSSGDQAGRLGPAGVLAHRLAVEAQGAGHLRERVSRLPMS